MPITSQQARAELARRELERRGVPLEEPTQISQEKPSYYEAAIEPWSRTIGSLGRGMYESIRPIVRLATQAPLPPATILSQMTGQPRQQVGMQMEQAIEDVASRYLPTPETKAEKLASAVGQFLPFSQMVRPFALGARALPFAQRLPAIAKSALTGLGYGGTRAAVMGEPIGKEALSTALEFAKWHTGGKLGATATPFAPRVGSALGAGAVGYATAPEGEKEVGGVFGAGLGAMYPSDPIKTHKFAKSVVNYALKPSKSTKKYDADPAEGIVKEGILGKNWQDTGEKVQVRLNELKDYQSRLVINNKNRNVRVDYTKGKVFEPIEKLIKDLKQDPEYHAATIADLELRIKTLSSNINLSDMNIEQAINLKQRLNKMSPKGIFSISDSLISDALHETYHNMNEAINTSTGITPELKTVNKRMQNLISAEKAIVDAKSRNSGFWNLLPMGMFGYGILGGQPWLAGIVGGRAALKTPAISTGIGRIFGEKYPRIPQGGQGMIPPQQPPPEPPIQPQPAVLNPILPTTGKGQTVNTMPSVPENIQKIVRKPKPISSSKNLITAIDSMQSQIDKYITEGKRPPRDLIDGINVLKSELRKRPLEITGVKTKELGKPTPTEGKVYHETSISSLRGLLSDADASGLYVSNNSELALGQTGKGVKIEFDKTKLLGDRGSLAKIKKPSLPFSESMGMGTEYRLIGGRTGIDKVSKITIEAGTKMDKVTKAILRNQFNAKQLENRNWEFTPKPTPTEGKGK